MYGSYRNVPFLDSSVCFLTCDSFVPEVVEREAVIHVMVQFKVAEGTK